jgi:hypothetical protein
MRSGWKNESYRHYLAAKGVKTNYYALQPMGKGNRLPDYYKSGFALGKSRDEIDIELRSQGRADLVVPRRQSATVYDGAVERPVQASDMPESFSRPVVVPVSTLVVEDSVAPPEVGLRPAVVMDSSDIEDEEREVWAEADAFDESIERGGSVIPPRELHTVMTPGVPPVPPSITDSSAGVQP